MSQSIAHVIGQVARRLASSDIKFSDSLVDVLCSGIGVRIYFMNAKLMVGTFFVY